MANIKSQIKRNKQNAEDRERNKAVKSELRTRTKNAVAAVGSDDEAAALRLAVKRIDKAAARGVIHKNTAANHKSRLVRRVAVLEAAHVVDVRNDADIADFCRIDGGGRSGHGHFRLPVRPRNS